MIVTETVSPSALTRGPGLVTTGGRFTSVTVQVKVCASDSEPSLADTVTV